MAPPPTELSAASALVFVAQLGLNSTSVATVKTELGASSIGADNLATPWLAIAILTLTLLFPLISLQPGTPAYTVSQNINW